MPAQEILNLALVQTALHWEDPLANRNQFTELLANLPPVDLIVLPEMFTTGFSMQPTKLAEEMEGPTLAWMKEMAALRQAAITGSIIIKERGRYLNRLLFVYPNGNYRFYDKKHLFTLAGEEKHYNAGTRKLILEYRGWRINPQICYDLRFPVWCRNSERFDLQIFVANWPERRAVAWKTLLKARAIENMCFAAGLNRVGKDGNGVYHSGDSVVRDPLGTRISYIEPGAQSVALVQLEYHRITEARSKFDFLNDGDEFILKPRPDLF
ncbi:MAG: amidohydrolase [Bacteroidetes bacterium]|nr:MAG: amidohydrolase [Bacteroidota bacterium]